MPTKPKNKPATDVQQEAAEAKRVVVKMGRLIPILNNGKITNSSPAYFSIWVEEADALKRECLYLTPYELAKLRRRAAKLTHLMTQKDRLVKVAPDAVLAGRPSAKPRRRPDDGEVAANENGSH